MSKRRLNLTVDEGVIERARRYSEHHGTSISHLVNQYLARLPDLDRAVVDEEGLTPGVRRLLGAAAGADRAAYREHLLDKYGP